MEQEPTENLSQYVPRAIEILTLFYQGEESLGWVIIREYSEDELQMLLACMATIAGGLLNVAYSCTEMPKEEWMPHFGSGLVGWFLPDD